MPTKDQVTYASEFNGKPIMTNEAQEQGCLQPVLQQLERQFEAMTRKHSKVLFIRYDVRFPADMPPVHDNTAIRAFHSDFIKDLSRKGLDPHYLTVREQSREKHQHYHGILLLDGHKTQNITGHLRKAEEIWERKLRLPPVQDAEADLPSQCRKHSRGLIDACLRDRNGNPQENGIMLRRDDPDYQAKINRCFYWGSYLAKENQKSNTPPGQRQLFASRTNTTESRYSGIAPHSNPSHKA